MGALQQLATSTYWRNFDHIFASIPIYDGSDRGHLSLAQTFRGSMFLQWKEHQDQSFGEIYCTSPECNNGSTKC